MDNNPLLWAYKGVALPHLVTKENLDAMRDFQVRDDDIVVASYPKTGTHWIVEIVCQILKAAGKSEVSADSMDVGPVEVTLPARQPGHVLLADTPSPRLVVTHLPIQFVPPGISKPQNKVKVLVPLRNPKDTTVSMFHFAQKMIQSMGLNIAVPWEKFPRDFIDGKVPYGDFCEHVLGWWQIRDDPHFLFLKYEDMKKDLLSAVKTIVAFLEVDLDEATIQAIAESSTFDKMKPGLDNSALPESRMISRKGIIGDWKNVFTPEENEMFDAWYKNKLGGTGITFDFE